MTLLQELYEHKQQQFLLFLYCIASVLNCQPAAVGCLGGNQSETADAETSLHL